LLAAVAKTEADAGGAVFEEKVGGVPLAAVWLGERPLWEPDGRQYPTNTGHPQMAQHQ
jgi:hypothetical protein